MSTSSDNLRMCYPEFSDATEYPDETLDFFILKASMEMEACVWGCFFEPASLALAAHMLSVAKKSAQAGDEGGVGVGGISQIKTRDLWVGYEQVGLGGLSASEKSLATTPYGLEYLRLSAKVGSTPLYVS